MQQQGGGPPPPSTHAPGDALQSSCWACSIVVQVPLIGEQQVPAPLYKVGWGPRVSPSTCVPHACYMPMHLSGTFPGASGAGLRCACCTLVCTCQTCQTLHDAHMRCRGSLVNCFTLHFTCTHFHNTRPCASKRLFMPYEPRSCAVRLVRGHK